MKQPFSSRGPLLCVVTWFLLVFIGTFSRATDFISHEEIQVVHEDSSVQSNAKDLAAGSWFGDVFVLPYSTQDSYDRFVGGNLNVGPRKWVAASFLQNGGDNYDFLLILTRFDFDMGGVMGLYWEIQNDVEGIGVSLFNHSDQFGSERLQGYIDGGKLSQYILQDGSINTELVTIILNHEMGHRWLAHPSFIDDNGERSTALLGLDGVHWSYLLDSDASYLYGSDWKDNNDGSFTAVDVESGFSDLDLYLMGLLKPGDVPPFTLLVNPTISAEALPHLGDTVDAVPVTVDISRIIAAEGVRNPDFSDAPKENRVALIYLVEDGAEISQAELDSIEEIRSIWRRSFFKETGGRALLDVGRFGPSQVSDPDFDLQAAKLWLENAAVDGLWQESQVTTVRDTTEALTALSHFSSSLPLVNAGSSALADLETGSVELRARQVEALELFGSRGRAEDLSEELLEREDNEGAWGAFERYSEDPVSSACVLRALSGLGTEPAVSQHLWSDLVDRQNPDGGWSWYPGGPSSVYPTLEVLLAGLETQSEPASIEAFSAAASWVSAQQRPDGGFGGSFSQILETSLFLRVFSRLSVDQSRINDAIVFLEERQEPNGSWSGRIIDTAAATTALAPYFMPDPYVLADEIVVTPPSPFEDDELVLQAAVRNSGGTLPSGATYRWELADAADPSHVWADFPGTLPAVASGGWVALNESWTPGVPAGSYLLRLLIDPESEWDDVHRSNNTAAVPLDIHAHPAGVDLALADSGVTVDPAVVQRVPQPTAIGVSIENLGRTAASGAEIAVYDGDPATGQKLGAVTAEVPALGSTVAQVPVQLAEPRAYTLTVTADPQDVLHDEDRTDNAVSLHLGLAATWDPAVVAGSFTAQPGTVTAGEPVTLSVNVANHGTRQLDALQVAFSYTDPVSGAEVPIVLQGIEAPLGPGESRTVQTQWRPSVSGSPVELAVDVDPDGNVDDLDRSNNSGSTELAVSPGTLPDLVVRPEDLTFDPAPVNQGESVAVTATVTNAGPVDAGAFVAEIRLDDPKDGELIASSNISGLASGASTTLSGTYAAEAGSDRLVYVVADPAEAVEELNEENNSAFRILDVLSLPDLSLTQGGIDADPGFPHAGETVHFTIEVENLGDQDAAATTVEIRDDAGNLLGTTDLDPVPAHGRGVTTFDWTAPSVAGDMTLHLEVNPAHTVTEQGYDNNLATLPVAVQDGSFYVSDRFLSPNGDGVKDSVTVFFREPVQTVSVYNASGGLVKTLNVSSGEMTATWDGSVDDGGIAPDGVYALQAGANPASVVVDTNSIPLTDSPAGVQVQRMISAETPHGQIDFLGARVRSAAGDVLYFLERRDPLPITCCGTPGGR